MDPVRQQSYLRQGHHLKKNHDFLQCDYDVVCHNVLSLAMSTILRYTGLPYTIIFYPELLKGARAF